MFIVILTSIIIVVLFLLYIQPVEGFADPYSLTMHEEISRKEDLWNLMHSWELYYFQDQTPIYERE